MTVTTIIITIIIKITIIIDIMIMITKAAFHLSCCSKIARTCSLFGEISFEKYWKTVELGRFFAHPPKLNCFSSPALFALLLAWLILKQLRLKTNLRISATVFNLPRMTGAADGVFGISALLCKVRLLPRAQGLAQNDRDWPLRCVALALACVAWIFKRFTIAPTRTSQTKRK